MGLLSKFVLQPIRNLFGVSTSEGYKTFTEHSPHFSAWDGNLYEQAKTRAIVERIAIACSKLRPEFVTPEGSGGSIPRVQRLVSSWPNDMMTWPEFLKRVATILFVETVAYVVPQFDERDAGSVIGLWPLKPSYAEVVEFEGEPWFRFHLVTGDVMAFPFYSVAVVTRFQLDSDIFGGGNVPLTPTLRLMDAQRQAEEVALRTGADIRFIGKLSGMVHQKDMEKKRQVFSDSNLSPSNRTGLMIYDQTFEDIRQIDNDPYVADDAAADRIDKALYAYFGINEKILTNSYNSEEWAAFYEGVIEPFALALSTKLTKMLLTPTQVRKGNCIMFSSGYLEYATPDTKVKVVGAMLDRGIYTVNESRDVLQLPRIFGGDVRMIRGEYYMIDDNNNIIAESGGRSSHDVNNGWHDDLDDIDEPDDHDDTDDVTRALRAQASRLIGRRVGNP